MPSYPKQALPALPPPSGLSRAATNGSTTSASLSPGREEVRRRSPRQTNSFDQEFSEKPALQRKKTIGLPSNPRATRITMAHEVSMAKPQTVMLMNDIVYDNPGMVKTIITEAPGMYASQRAKPMERSAFSVTTVAPSLKSSNSVIHRPRPYKRDRRESDRVLFPSEPSPGHRRSRSGSSITPRKSLLMAQPGSPTMLPPLPPPPITSAADLKRLLPNDTKSMTFDEKIELLFPAPPGQTLSRRSSVPSLPRLPSVFMSDSPVVQSPVEDDRQSHRASKRTTIASFAVPEIPPKSIKRQSMRREEPQAYRFSAQTYRTIADEVGETWIPGISSPNIEPRNRMSKAPERQSVAYDMRKSHWTEATSSDESFIDDATTYWGSVHSEIPAVDLSKARQNANSLVIQPPNAKQQRNSMRVLPPLPPLPQLELGENEAFVPVMLDSEENRKSLLLSSNHNRHSFLLDADQSLPGDKTPVSIKNEPNWHHRIGDELPTFSERTSSVKRKMPPPTPLLLNRTGTRATVVVRAAEPSPPTDDPERAILDIQEQLKRFEEQPSRGSVGSILKRMPGNQTEDAPNTGRFQLLDNLEKEMEQQDNHWQQMQTNLDRDSISTMMSPYTQAGSEGSLTRKSSQESIHNLAKIQSRRARVRSSMTVRSKSDDSGRTTSTQSSDNSRASVWQQRLAEAQIEYMENAPTLLRKKSLNFLSVTKIRTPILSPTPPDSVVSETDIETDLESDSDTEAMKQYQAPQKVRPTLWQPMPASPKAAMGRMWSPPYETSDSSTLTSEPPAKDVRPAQRRLEQALPIFSTKLWIKPRSLEHSRPVVGLWGSKLARPRSIRTRPLTQRPQRKSRRMTFLPDIVESPVPIPNKRETLGIFQFPWGETSDQPVFQPTFIPTLPGPVINAKLDARSKQLEPDMSEYSSSFFDDYEEEDSELDEPESDDDFDESTLWEIANLLNTNDVPSKASLLPAARAHIIDDYDDDSEPTSPDSAVPPPVSRLPIQPLAFTTRPEAQLWAATASPLEVVAPGLPQPVSSVWSSLIPSADNAVRTKARSNSALPALSSGELWTATVSLKVESSDALASSLWTSDAITENSPTLSNFPSISSLTKMWTPKEDVLDNRKSGLFTVPLEVVRTTNAAPAAINMNKTARPTTEGPQVISSNNLWTRPQHFVEATSWMSRSVKPTTQASTTTSTSMMWSPATKTVEAASLGLFDASINRSNFRSSDAMPAALNMIYKPRTSSAPLSELTSTRLWHGQGKLDVEHHWISESSVRPESPSVYSATSSGSSSPASDSSSVKSTSTKASSFWSTSMSAIPNWWDKTKKAPAISADDDSKHPSKIPVRQPSQPQLTPVRESRVLASRDLWESRVPVLESTPAGRFRRASAAQQSPQPVQKPARQQKPIASPSDWNNALAEAVAAGIPQKSMVPRPVAKKSDWESALTEAISKSRLRLHRTAYTTAQWENALNEAITAGTLKSAVATAYDPSILHPVFFTNSLTFSAADIHPAAIGHFTKMAQPGMWTPSIRSSIPKPAALWSKDTVSTRVALMEIKVVGVHVRKASMPAKGELPTLESNSFWQPSNVALKERNWLISTTKQAVPAHTWTPSAALPSLDGEDNLTMWTMKPVTTLVSPDKFAHIKAQHVKPVSSSRPAALQRLNSSELYKSNSVATSEKTNHWLHETSLNAPTAPATESATWTAPALEPSKLQNGLMWQKESAHITAVPALFANAPSDPWSHRKRNGGALARIQSTDLWHPSGQLPESPKNWLIERKISKVVFRY